MVSYNSNVSTLSSNILLSVIYFSYLSFLAFTIEHTISFLTCFHIADRFYVVYNVSYKSCITLFIVYTKITAPLRKYLNFISQIAKYTYKLCSLNQTADFILYLCSSCWKKKRLSSLLEYSFILA